MGNRLRGFSSKELLERAFPLLGRVAFVGGGSGQLGSATIDKLCSLGCSVAFTYHSNRKAAARIVGRNSRFFEKHSLKSKIIAISSDEQAKKRVSKEFGKIDFIVCFQDLVFKNGLWDGADKKLVEAEKHLPYEIAYVGTRDCIESLEPLMKNGGSILVISSTTAMEGKQYRHGKYYSIPKAYLIELAKKYAKALAKRGITVNVGIWGWVPKGVEDPKELKNELRKIPLRRFGKPDDIADACFSIITTRWMTGQGIVVDGGQTMHINGMRKYLKDGKRLFNK
ncbi:MAG: SDR family oxidoreductase [Candidatus Aenigmarchaeota archaeon]|nr:SDR family oxidoreductase [Candidatus Aenigmarchaeota archaeon]